MPQQLFLNFLGNYIPNEWTTSRGCKQCGGTPLPPGRSEWPYVLLALFIESPTPFLLEVLEKVTQLDYPKNRISLWVHCSVRGWGGCRDFLLQLMPTLSFQTSYHETLVNGWVELVQPLYRNVTYVGPERGVAESVAKETTM